MLVDHAKAECGGILRALDARLAPIDHDLAGGRVVEAHHAFHERRFAGAVLAQ